MMKKIPSIIICMIFTAALVLSAGCIHADAASKATDWAKSTKNPFYYQTYYDNATYYTTASLQHNSDFSSKRIYYGADISHWNNDRGRMNFKTAKAMGVDFVFIKVAGTSTGNSFSMYSDDYYRSNIEDALEAGMKVGVYYFSQAKTVSEAKKEAKYILNIVKKYNIDLPVVMDYEYAGGRLTSSSPSKTVKTKCVRAFCDTVKAAGYTPMIYGNLYFLNNSISGISLSKEYMVWVAQYNSHCDFEGNYQFWQYSDAGKMWKKTNGVISGFRGNTDSDVWYATSSEFNSNLNSPMNVSLSTENLPEGTLNSEGNFNYTGSALTPDVDVTDSKTGKALVKGTDYTLSYSNNTYPGEAQVTIKGLGSYKGYTRYAYFYICGSLSDESHLSDFIESGLSYTTCTFTGKARTPSIEFKYFEKDVDYTVTYKNNTDAGTASVTFKGISSICTGTYSTTFQIKARSIANTEYVTASAGCLAYTGEDLHSLILASLNVSGKYDEIKENTDYTVSLDSAAEDTVGSRYTTVTGNILLTGTGNYTGTRSVSYKIGPDIGDSDVFTAWLEGASLGLDNELFMYYTGKALKPKITIVQEGTTTTTVTDDGTGGQTITSTYDPDRDRTLTEGTDYTVEYGDNLNAGQATVTAAATGDTYGGEVKCGFTILPRQATDVSAKLSFAGATYNGKAKTPSAKCTYNGMTLEKGKDYRISYSKGRIKVGTYFVYLEFKGNYTGSKTLKLIVKPKKTYVKSLSRAKRSLTVKWKKLSSSYVSGYQIRYSTSSSMKNASVRTIRGSSAASKIIKNLKSGKKYYVQVRTYKKVGGKTYHSFWSKKKTATAL